MELSLKPKILPQGCCDHRNFVQWSDDKDDTCVSKSFSYFRKEDVRLRRISRSPDLDTRRIFGGNILKSRPSSPETEIIRLGHCLEGIHI
ncbi:hypothetical protein AVEN_172801-1 [Araneus ventricosus]|uniref:Uncharacterized protein n=1 Tax=Araneus ventricosus TaxID=182803 RepID=A0A4Y2BI12_ARAVE|nr:hypothetical protein AVEN_172801-1 [Araneus ventricosus]